MNLFNFHHAINDSVYDGTVEPDYKKAHIDDSPVYVFDGKHCREIFCVSNTTTQKVFENGNAKSVNLIYVKEEPVQKVLQSLNQKYLSLQKMDYRLPLRTVLKHG